MYDARSSGYWINHFYLFQFRNTDDEDANFLSWTVGYRRVYTLQTLRYKHLKYWYIRKYRWSEFSHHFHSSNKRYFSRLSTPHLLHIAIYTSAYIRIKFAFFAIPSRRVLLSRIIRSRSLALYTHTHILFNARRVEYSRSYLEDRL